MMNIGILAVGTRGDVQPCVALARELKQYFNVTILTHEQYKNLVIANKIDFIELSGNTTKNWDNNDDKPKISMWKQLEDFGREWIEKSLEFCNNYDALLFTPLCYLGPDIAEKLNIPCFSIMFEPNIPTKSHSTPYSSSDRNFRLTNKLTFSVSNQTFWQPMRKIINRLRKELLSLPPHSFWGPQKNNYKKMKYLCAYSNYLSPRPLDWDQNVIVTGYWFLNTQSQFQLDDNLVRFLGEGGKPIMVDLGSFSHESLHNQIELIINDISDVGLRLLIYPGKLDVSKYTFPEETYFLDSKIPHISILDKVQILITHGGVGAVHAAIKAGVPCISVSLFGAQYFWGKKLFQNKLSAKPLRIRKLKSGDIRASIEFITKGPEINDNTARFSAKINSEVGCSNAVEFIRHELSN